MLMQTFYLLLAYLVGSIPVGLILATLYADVDIRETGSGNIGATNVLRSTGRALAVVTLACDLVKGLLPTLGAFLLFEGAAWAGVVGLLTVAGHCWSIYLEFRGGKGVATGAGVMLALAPAAALLTAAVWMLSFALSRRASVSALIALPVLQLALAWLAPEWLWVGVILGAVLVLRHRDNIRRILHGEEQRMAL